MNINLLIMITYTLTLVHGFPEVVHNMGTSSVPIRYNQYPCQRNNDNNAYNKFFWKHILKERFKKTTTVDEWTRYLKNHRLCNRPQQSFIRKKDERRVQEICNGSGLRLYNNLCFSNSTMVVYDIKVHDSISCKIESLKRGKKRVIVACDKIKNQCLPVHFKKYENQRPDTRAQLCKLLP